MNIARLLWIGGACLIAGWALTFLTVLKVFEPGFMLAFFSVSLLFIGTIVGFYGVYAAFRANRAAR